MRPLQALASTFGTVAVIAALAACTSSAPAQETPEPPPAQSSTTAAGSDDPWAEVKMRYPDAEIPEVSFVRYVTREEWPVAQSDCLQQQGFSVESTADDGIQTYVSNEQAQAYLIAGVSCSIMYPLDPIYTTPLTDAQIQKIYDYQTGGLSDCLKNMGFETTEPPSLETFKATYGQEGSWSPYLGLELASDQWAEMNTTCPQLPSDLYE